MDHHQKDEFVTIMERMSKNKDIERGLVHLSTIPTNQCDPVVREMAIAVLHEIERVKKKRERKDIVGCTAILVAIVIIVIVIAVGAGLKMHRY